MNFWLPVTYLQFPIRVSFFSHGMIISACLQCAISAFPDFFTFTFSHKGTHLLRPDVGAKYCDERVCMSVRSHRPISNTTRPNFKKSSVHVSCGCGSVLL